MADSFITLASGDKVATTTYSLGPNTIHLQKFLATNSAGLPNAFGAGNVDATTPRVTLAANDPAVAALGEVKDALTAPVAELPPRPMRTDVANFPTRTQIEVDGADTDELLPAAGAGKRQFVYSGWLQTDIDCVITFKSGTTVIAKPISLKAGAMLKIGAPGTELPEIYTGANEALNLTKSTAAVIKGVLYSKAA